jgi:hypothetical protein
VDDTTPMKTATYYTQNLQEAHKVASVCKELDAQKQRNLGTGDYQEWQISNEGVNCQTAVSVSEAASLREFVLKQARPVAAPKSSAPPRVVPAAPTPERSDEKISSTQSLAP